jgi:hypothetical protein
MTDALKSPTLLYQVIVPVRGVPEGQHRSRLLPQGTLLKIVPDAFGTPLVRVRWKGKNYSVLEQDLMQWCQTVDSA